MILVLGKDTDAHVKWLREKLNKPIMTADTIHGIRNLLPSASVVFIRPITYAWKTRLELPEHPNVFMVGAQEEKGSAEHCMRNFREAQIKDVFLVDDPEDEARLIARFEEQVIDEVDDADDQERMRDPGRRPNRRLDGDRVEAVPTQPF